MKAESESKKKERVTYKKRKKRKEKKRRKKMKDIQQIILQHSSDMKNMHLGINVSTSSHNCRYVVDEASNLSMIIIN